MIRGDSSEYELLNKWAAETPVFDSPDTIITCEIGVREGLGSKVIMDVFRDRLQGSKKKYIHIGIDPYDNLKYQHYDNSPAYTADYTDDMRKQMIDDFKEYPEFKFHHMTDTQFMKDHFFKKPYHFVHFDGPHMSRDVMTESIFFAERSVKGTRFVFDDHPKYEMSIIAYALTVYGFKTIEMGDNKACLEKVT